MTARVSSQAFVDALLAEGAGPFIGVPCSYLRPFIDYVIDRDDLTYIAATNEGEALAIAAGAQLAGRRPVVMLQNSGLGNLVNPLASLTHPFAIPVLMIITLRGDPDGAPDEPQHTLMGRVTRDLLTTLNVAHAEFPTRNEDVASSVAHSMSTMRTTGQPFAFVLRKGTVDEYTPRQRAQAAAPASAVTRADALTAVHASLPPDAIVVATTGHTGREWFEREDRTRNLYLVGSMGCAASVGLGVAMHTTAPVIVLDGDGAALMRLEAMASVGHQAPRRFIHVVLDNAAYDSTGTQATISPGIDFPAIARACGYRHAEAVTDATALGAAVVRCAAIDGPHLIHLRIAPGSTTGLGRPTIAPRDVAERLRQAMRDPQ